MENNIITQKEIEDMTWDEIQENIKLLQKADCEYVEAEGGNTLEEFQKVFENMAQAYDMELTELTKSLLFAVSNQVSGDDDLAGAVKNLPEVLDISKEEIISLLKEE